MALALIILSLFLLAEKTFLLLFCDVLYERDGDLHRSVRHSCGSLCKDESCSITLVFSVCEDPQYFSLAECIVDGLVAKDDAVVRCKRKEV